MTLEGFWADLENLPEEFKPYVAVDDVVRVAREHWCMNPVTALAVAGGLQGSCSNEEISDPAFAARLLGLDHHDGGSIWSASEYKDHPLRPRLLKVLGLTS